MFYHTIEGGVGGDARGVPVCTEKSGGGDGSLELVHRSMETATEQLPVSGKPLLSLVLEVDDQGKLC